MEELQKIIECIQEGKCAVVELKKKCQFILFK